jgi:dimeric dUTPase (all-alpha-NTP-PPase superfamily)
MIVRETRKITSRGMRLHELLQIQSDFQTAYFPIRNIPLSSLASAVACEAMEIWAASGKWWYKNNREDLEKIKEESIDILHFLLMLWLKLGMNENQIADLYRKKMQVNIQRQTEGNTRTL